MNKGRRTALICLVGITLLTAYAQRTDYTKMSALVRKAVSTKGARHLTAFVQTTDEQTTELWRQTGCRELTRLGDIAIVDIPTTALPQLSAHPAVRRIEAGRRPHALMDTTRQVVNALPAYTATAQHQAFTGRGVVVGLMDVGFDLTHPTFYDATATNYRIKAFWDQLSPDTVGSTMPLGREYVTQQEILAKGCSTDSPTQNHGTHTLGIAAGSGYDSPYCGMAPESDICLVNNAVTEDTIYIRPEDYEKYTTAVDALGFKYLFDYADSQGMPCVVSFSEGYYEMADEDDRLFAEFMNRLDGPGHIMVVSAGNEGLTTDYLEKPAGTPTAGAFLHTGQKEATYRIQSDGRFLLHLMAYRSGSSLPTDTLTVSSADGRLDSLLTDTLFFDADTCAVSISRHPSFYGNDTIYVLNLTANRPFYNMPQIAFVAEGDSHVQMYATRSQSLSNGGFYSNKPIDERWCDATIGHNILAPGSFPAAICVGAMAYRMQIANYQGDVNGAPGGGTAGQRSPASSTGPSMDGRLKPEVMAPGINIVSASNSYYLEHHTKPSERAYNVAFFDFGGRTYGWLANSGTSMSCPVVAGSIALWLQANPRLTRDDVIAIFSRTCRQPIPGDSYPNNEYGYGEIDTYRGLLDILGLSRIETISQQPLQDVVIRPGNGFLQLTFSRQPSAPVRVAVYSAAGRLCQQSTITSHDTTVRLPLPSLSAGVYAVSLTSADQHLCGSTLIRL